jgi:adenine deaminase
MDYREFLKKMPKIELHIHLIGCVRAETLIEIAKKNDVSLPDYEKPEDLYWKQWFFDGYPMVCSVLKDADDFHRIAYEAQQDGAATGIRYRELFWSPSIHMAAGIAYQTALEGVT